VSRKCTHKGIYPDIPGVKSVRASVLPLTRSLYLARFMSLKRPAAIVRSEYLIDRYLVVFESGVGSHCACEEFRAAKECRHTRESEGRRAAQELIAKRVRSIDGTLVGFGHRIQRNDARTSKRERTRSLSLTRIR
jgi:hypothetical protein